jgi:hypothetical protein
VRQQYLILMIVSLGMMVGVAIFAAASVTSQFLGRPRMGDLEAMLRRASTSPERSV